MSLTCRSLFPQLKTEKLFFKKPNKNINPFLKLTLGHYLKIWTLTNLKCYFLIFELFSQKFEVINQNFKIPNSKF